MSVVPASQANVPVTLGSGLDGLEDFDRDDVTMPTITIEHSENSFKDSLSGQLFNKINVVLLGLVKQRILWPPEVGEEKEAPLCRSYDFNTGHPGEKFPWDASGFQRPAGDTEGVQLPCANCKLKDWGSHPSRDVAWCSTQYTFPLLRITEDGEYVPSLLTLQRSALKPANTYLSSFVNEQKALYTVETELSLDPRKKGSVKFSVPILKRGSSTDDQDWQQFSEQLRGIRMFLQTPRVTQTEDDTDPVTGAAPAPTAQAATPAPPAQPAPAATTAAPAQPAPTAAAPAASAPADDDDIPF